MVNVGGVLSVTVTSKEETTPEVIPSLIVTEILYVFGKSLIVGLIV